LNGRGGIDIFFAKKLPEQRRIYEPVVLVEEFLEARSRL
jgi:hypothetical protein